MFPLVFGLVASGILLKPQLWNRNSVIKRHKYWQRLCFCCYKLWRL